MIEIARTNELPGGAPLRRKFVMAGAMSANSVSGRDTDSERSPFRSLSEVASTPANRMGIAHFEYNILAFATVYFFLDQMDNPVNNISYGEMPPKPEAVPVKNSFG